LESLVQQQEEASSATTAAANAVTVRIMGDLGVCLKIMVRCGAVPSRPKDARIFQPWREATRPDDGCKAKEAAKKCAKTGRGAPFGPSFLSIGAG